MPNPIVNNLPHEGRPFISLVMLESDRYWADLVTRSATRSSADDPRFVDSTARAKNSWSLRHHPRRHLRLEDLRGVEAICRGQGRVGAGPDGRRAAHRPQVIANDYLRDVEANSGTVFKMVASPLQFNEEPPDLTRAPEHGEHTDEVLGELGLDMDAILDLKVKGVVL